MALPTSHHGTRSADRQRFEPDRHDDPADGVRLVEHGSLSPNPVVARGRDLVVLGSAELGVVAVLVSVHVHDVARANVLALTDRFRGRDGRLRSRAAARRVARAKTEERRGNQPCR